MESFIQGPALSRFEIGSLGIRDGQEPDLFNIIGNTEQGGGFLGAIEMKCGER